MLRLIPALLLCLLSSLARAEAPPPSHGLPFPLGAGADAGYVGPAPSLADLAGHFRGALVFSADRPGSPALTLRYRLGASATLWGWGKFGVNLGGILDLDAARHHASPVEMFARFGPPNLGGASLQLVLEHVTARGGFDEGNNLWDSTTDVGGVLGLRRGRFRLLGSATYEHGAMDGGGPRYDGARFSLGAWFLAIRATEHLGLEVGGDALVRVGGEEGPRGALDTAALFGVGVRLVDEWGAAFKAGYGQGFGRGMPTRFGLVGMGYSYGNGYKVPPPVLPPLLPEIEEWMREQLRKLFAPAPPPSVAPWLQHLPPVPLGGAYCSMPFDLLPPPVVVHDCVVGGPPVVLERDYRVAAYRETVEDVKYVAYQVGRAWFYGTSGLVCGLMEGTLPFYKCLAPSDPVFQLGRGVGQVGAGLAQVVVGGGGEVAGVGLDATGVGAGAGVLVGAGSTVLIVNGGRAVYVGAQTVVGAVGTMGTQILATVRYVPEAPTGKAPQTAKAPPTGEAPAPTGEAPKTAKAPPTGEAPAPTGEAPKGGTYKLVDDKQATCYAGQSCDLARREREHNRDPRMQGTRLKVDRRTDSYPERRGREQQIYDETTAKTGAPPPLNRQRPVSRKNKRLDEYRKAAGALLKRDQR